MKPIIQQNWNYLATHLLKLLIKESFLDATSILGKRDK